MEAWRTSSGRSGWSAITIWNTVYLDAALAQFRETGYQVLDTDVTRLSPYMRKHINVHGRYTFHLPDLGGQRRAPRDPETTGDEDDR